MSLVATPASTAPSRLFWFGFATAIGVLQASYRWLDEVARGRVNPVYTKLIEELSSAYGVLLLLPMVLWWTRRVQRDHFGVTRVLMHVPSLLVFSVLHTTWNASVRPLAFRVFGLGEYDYGLMPARYLMEFSIHVILYGLLVGSIILIDARRAAREREARLARVEAELATAQVRALESRLQPHFLFNALNTISSVMYTDPAAADTMLARLGDLLRRTLRTGPPEVALSEEMETVELWLDVMRARFGDRLTVDVHVPDDVQHALVPPMLLQPLLENAFKHGVAASNGRVRTPPRIPADESSQADEQLHVQVRAERVGDALQLDVQDDGPGLSVPEHEAFSRGIGLSTTKQRLTSLYADRASITLENSEGGGLRVRVRVPWREVQAHA